MAVPSTGPAWRPGPRFDPLYWGQRHSAGSADPGGGGTASSRAGGGGYPAARPFPPYRAQPAVGGIYRPAV